MTAYTVLCVTSGTSNPHSLEVSDNQVKLMEAKARIEEARARAKVAEAQARVADANEQVSIATNGVKRRCSTSTHTRTAHCTMSMTLTNPGDGTPPAEAPIIASISLTARGNICEMRGNHIDILGPVTTVENLEWPMATINRTAPDSGRAAVPSERRVRGSLPQPLQIEQALGCAHGTVNSLWKADGVFRAVYRFKRITLVP